MTRLTAPLDVVWVKRPIIKMHDNPPPESQWRYGLLMPDWLAEWDVYADWERARFLSMEEHLSQGDVLFDIGTELGWQSIIYAQFVGPENMVLIEPAGTMWPNIKAVWERNYPYDPPLACHYGLMSDKTTSNFVLPKHLFPAEAEGSLTHNVAYKYIHEHALRMPQITIDDYVERTGIMPDALTMDVEGAELLVLRGAKATLESKDLNVWVSIHPELAEKDYGYTPEELLEFMAECGYSGVHLASDHEEHWCFLKAEA